MPSTRLVFPLPSERHVAVFEGKSMRCATSSSNLYKTKKFTACLLTFPDVDISTQYLSQIPTNAFPLVNNLSTNQPSAYTFSFVTTNADSSGRSGVMIKPRDTSNPASSLSLSASKAATRNSASEFCFMAMNTYNLSVLSPNGVLAHLALQDEITPDS